MRAAYCHLPSRRGGAVKNSPHLCASPLKSADQSCGPCHADVTYVVERVAKIQKQVNDEPFKDWTHAISGAPMIKMQHPEYELFTADSTPYKAGVA